MSFLPTGAVPSPGALLDERSRPDFRDVFGQLARRSEAISVAVTRVRITTVDLTREELQSVTSLRVLVAELSALRLDGEARALRTETRRSGNVAHLVEMLESKRLEVRSAPLGGWSPDFSVFASDGAAHSVLTGFHWFERPYPHRGPALASLHAGDAARLAAKRFEDVWDSAHDVGPAVWSILARAETGRSGHAREAG